MRSPPMEGESWMSFLLLLGALEERRVFFSLVEFVHLLGRGGRGLKNPFHGFVFSQSKRQVDTS